MHFVASCKAYAPSGTSHYSTTATMGQVTIFVGLTNGTTSLICICADLGKVLAGIQVPPNDGEEFDRFLRNLGYPYVEETLNEVYKQYLRG